MGHRRGTLVAVGLLLASALTFVAHQSCCNRQAQHLGQHHSLDYTFEVFNRVLAGFADALPRQQHQFPSTAPSVSKTHRGQGSVHMHVIRPVLPGTLCSLYVSSV